MLAYLVESWSKSAGWRLVGWFPGFGYAMHVATALPVARVRRVDLDLEARQASSKQERK